MTRIIGAAELCAAGEEVVNLQLPRLIVALDWATELNDVTSWQQVPTLRALSTAQLPAGAITSPGLTGKPIRHGDGSYEATWRVVFGILDRGKDYDTTALRARRWAGLLRAVLTANPTLGGIGHSLLWVSEEYDQWPDRKQAATLGGCAVGIDITVRNVVDVSGIVLDPDGPTNPPTSGDPGDEPPPFVPAPRYVESVHPAIIHKES